MRQAATHDPSTVLITDAPLRTTAFQGSEMHVACHRHRAAAEARGRSSVTVPEHLQRETAKRHCHW